MHVLFVSIRRLIDEWLIMDFAKRKSFEMGTEDHYKQKAKNYKTSPEYGKMISLYPVLKTTIKDCKGENLVA